MGFVDDILNAASLGVYERNEEDRSGVRASGGEVEPQRGAKTWLPPRQSELEALRREVEALRVKAEDTGEVEALRRQVEALQREGRTLRVKAEDTSEVEALRRQVEALQREGKALREEMEDTERPQLQEQRRLKEEQEAREREAQRQLELERERQEEGEHLLREREARRYEPTPPGRRYTSAPGVDTAGLGHTYTPEDRDWYQKLQKDAEDRARIWREGRWDD
jgi:hypothetical protein